MKKKIDRRNNIIIMLCITIIVLAIGFTYLSIKLYNYNKASYDVSFVKVEKKASIKGGNIDPIGDVKIKSNGKILDMNYTLTTPHDELEYSVYIRNEGTIPSEISELIESPSYSKSNFSDKISPVTIKYSNVVGKILLPGEETELKIIVKYNPSTIKSNRSFSCQLGLITSSK